MKIMQILQLIVSHNWYNYCIQADARSLTDAHKACTSFRKEEETENINVESYVVQAFQSKSKLKISIVKYEIKLLKTFKHVFLETIFFSIGFQHNFNKFYSVHLKFLL